MSGNKLAVLDYRTPESRALATLGRQLLLDAIGIIGITLAAIPMEGAVNWRAIGVAGAILLAKTSATTLTKYARAIGDDYTSALEFGE